MIEDTIRELEILLDDLDIKWITTDKALVYLIRILIKLLQEKAKQ